MAPRRTMALAAMVGAALTMTLSPTAAVAAPAVNGGPDGQPAVDGARTTRADNLPNPLAEAQAQLHADAVAKLISGEASTTTVNGERVIALPSTSADASTARGQASQSKNRYVWYPVDRQENIFTVLTDFGTQIDPATGGEPGPAHNQIPPPDRTWDGNATDNNTTYWLPDFNRDHYMSMMFGPTNSFRDFYQKQSNGRFLASGDVSNWVTVPYNEARYGSNALSDAAGYWPYIADTASAWCAAEKAAGKSTADIQAYLAQFDQVDRYDYDGDGVFNEPDGYVDHFQAIHAGEGEEAGGGAQGSDAIWSHRWYANLTDIGQAGPAENLAGGVPLCDTGMWIGDYTTEPENGGLGVFTHEFGHDLGLRDYYDTQGGDNSTGFWTLMSSGSWLSEGKEAIGTKPGYMGPHEKLLLGWLDYTVAATSGEYTLGLADLDGVKTAQALAVPLPPKNVTTEYNTPHSGQYEWWGGSDDNLNTSLTRTVDVPPGTSAAALSAWTWFNIEQDYDALFTEVSTDGGASWTRLTADGDTKDLLDGVQESWVQRTWDLTPYAGQSILARFRYLTDGGLHFSGAFLDDIAVTADGAALFSDDVENGDNGWTADGFTRMSGTTTTSASHYYLAENRQYSGYDTALKTGPYQFGWANSKPEWVQHFAFNPGLLVWYVDNTYSDNNTSQHPGGGFALPVDSHPAPILFPAGGSLANRRGAFDATFTKEDPKKVTFYRNGIPVTVKDSKAVKVFDDSNPLTYWTANNPMGSVQVAGNGTKIEIRDFSKNNTEVTLRVTRP